MHVQALQTQQDSHLSSPNWESQAVAQLRRATPQNALFSRELQTLPCPCTFKRVSLISHLFSVKVIIENSLLDQNNLILPLNLHAVICQASRLLGVNSFGDGAEKLGDLLLLISVWMYESWELGWERGRTSSNLPALGVMVTTRLYSDIAGA